MEVKENIPIDGEEVVRNGKMISSAAMVTPRKPLMDLSQVPRTATDDPKLMKPGTKSSIITPKHTPLLKRTHSKKMEPSTLIYEDKTECTSNSVQSITRESAKSVESLYLNKLQKSVEDKMVERFVSQVIDKCVADIQSDSSNMDGAGMNNNDPNTSSQCLEVRQLKNNAINSEECSEAVKVIESGESENQEGQQHEDGASRNNVDENWQNNLADHLYCARTAVEEYQGMKYESKDNGAEHCLEMTSDHNYCVTDSRMEECPEKNLDHNYCVTDLPDTNTTVDEELESCMVLEGGKNVDEGGVDNSIIDNLQSGEDETAVKDCYCLMEEGEYFIDKSNVSRIDYTDLEFIELEVRDETETGTGHSPGIFPGSETEKETEFGGISEADVDSDTKSGSSSQLDEDNDAGTEVTPQSFKKSRKRTSLIPVPVRLCDASPQFKPDSRSASNSPFVPYKTHSATTSPCIPYETHSATTSPFVPYETHSAMTSPFIPYTTQTTSVNTDNIETADVEVGTELPPTIYVNIIKDQPEVRSISVSTDESFDTGTETGNDLTRPVEHNMHKSEALNSEIGDFSSVITRTDPRDYSEISVMTEMIETVDTGVGVVVDTTDIGVEVQPTVVNVATEMTDLPMSTVGTSMTPLKLQHKNGKRTTAEDIRRQHPRVLANELDSLRLQNERLESNIKSVEHERDKLKSLLKETKGSLHKVEKDLAERVGEKDIDKDKIWELANRCEELEAVLQRHTQTSAAEVEQLQTRCQTIEEEKNKQIAKHADQMLKLKEEYEKTNYRDHFLASQKLVQQLQAELSEYSQLLYAVEHSQQIQSKLEAKMSETFRKVKLAEESVIEHNLDLRTRETELTFQSADLETREAALRRGEAELAKEQDRIEELVRGYKVEADELNKQYKQSCDDLAEATTRLESLTSELDQTQTDLTQCQTDKHLVEEKYEGSIQRETSLQREIELLQITLKQREECEQAANTRLRELEDRLQHETEAHKQTRQQSYLEIVNLQHTLESREQDIDSLEKDLFECREIIYTQMEKIRGSEEREKQIDAEIKSVVAENTELKGCCASLRAKEQELRETLKYTQEELSGTREHASRLLKEQGTEMADCSTMIGQLTDHMTSVLTNLTQKAGIQKTPVKSSVEPMKSHDPDSAIDLSKPSHDAEQSQGSLVSMILKAISTQDSKEINNDAAVSQKNMSENSPDQENGRNQDVGQADQRQIDVENGVIDLSCQTAKQALDNVDSPTTLSRKKLGHSGASAFAPVRSGGPLSGCIKPKPGPLSSNSVLHTLSSVQTVTENSEKSWLNTQTDSETDSLPVQVEKLSEIFEEINRLVVLLEKASRSALQDIRRDNEELNCRVSQLEFAERRLTADLEYSRKELQHYKDVNKDLEGNLEQMSDRLGHYIETEAEVKRLQQEMGHLHGKIQSLEAEKEFLNDQMSELLAKLEEAQSQTSEPAQASVVDVNTRKEILTLQKKVHHLKKQLQERQDYIEEVSNKAARRIQKLEDNWKKADSEVLRFDELVDVIRERLVKSETLMRDSEEVRKVIRLIDGKESVSSLKRSDKLKPIKTSLV